MPIDMSAAAKAPPRKSAAGSGPTRRTASVSVPETLSQAERRMKGLSELAQLGQGLLLMTGQYADAAAIGQHFGPVARELANIADGSDAVAKPIDLLIEVGPYGALIAAVMPLAMQVMANHKLLKADMLMSQGVVPPELLEAQMKAQVARMQSDAMKAHQVAMREAEAAQRELDEMMAQQRVPA